jgi:hypothetical protein
VSEGREIVQASQPDLGATMNVVEFDVGRSALALPDNR